MTAAEKLLHRLLSGLALSGGRNAKLSILIYHDIAAEPDPFRCDAISHQEFAEQAHILAETCNVLPLSDAINKLQDGSLPPRSVCISFDDGYLGAWKYAVPILEGLNMPSSFFVVPKAVETGWMWDNALIDIVERSPIDSLDLSELGLPAFKLLNTQQRITAATQIHRHFYQSTQQQQQQLITLLLEQSNLDSPTRCLIDETQLRDLSSRGFELGSHTYSHVALARTDIKTAEQEIANGRETLEGIIGRAAPLFAYPVGRPGRDYRYEHTELIKRLGFKAALTTGWGAATRHSNPFQLPRFTPWDKQPHRFLARLYYNAQLVKSREL